MTHQELAQKIYNVCHLKGDFLLRSGQRSSEYFDKYRFESQPQLLKEIAEQMKSLITADTEILAALEMGSIETRFAIQRESHFGNVDRGPAIALTRDRQRFRQSVGFDDELADARQGGGRGGNF